MSDMSDALDDGCGSECRQERQSTLAGAAMALRISQTLQGKGIYIEKVFRSLWIKKCAAFERQMGGGSPLPGRCHEFVSEIRRHNHQQRMAEGWPSFLARNSLDRSDVRCWQWWKCSPSPLTTK
jgi:hypothetical protein